MFFHGVTEKYREGVALIVNSLGGFSLTALQLSHPRMIFVADLSAFGNWQLLEEIRDREEGAVTAEGTEEDGFSFWWGRSHKQELAGH